MSWEHIRTAAQHALTPAEAAAAWTEGQAMALEEVIAAFASSAVRCIEVGFDAVEIHAVNVYLIDSFL